MYRLRNPRRRNKYPKKSYTKDLPRRDRSFVFCTAGSRQKRGKMRIDKFLKVSRLIKRRTVANEAASAGRVKINGKVVKPSEEVKIGDIIEIGFGQKSVKAEVLSISNVIRKEEADGMIRYLSGE